MKRLRRAGHESRVALFVLLGGLPAVAFALGLVWLGDHSSKLRWTVTLIAVGSWLVGAARVREAVLRPLQTLSNLLVALREGDYSIRGRTGLPQDALSTLVRELNVFADLLRDQRLGDVETAALLAKLMNELDVVVLAVGEGGQVRIANRAAEALLQRPLERIVGESMRTLGLAPLLEGEAPRRVALPSPADGGDWELRRSPFRQKGKPHTLIVLTDLRRALREEERIAWQRLVRVLGHEINNSLAPIRSLAENLRTVRARSPRPADAEEDLDQGLEVIQRRAESLNRFMGAFTQLARLPPPRRQTVEVAGWVSRVASLETRLPVQVEPGPAIAFEGDPDQLDQVLINLVRNAADASLETGGGVRIRWSVQRGALEVIVQDDGPGVLNPSNLFVPFFTTKPQGTGIGLTLSRQIIENHGGTLRLENRAPTGCNAVLTFKLPRSGSRT